MRTHFCPKKSYPDGYTLADFHFPPDLPIRLYFTHPPRRRFLAAEQLFAGQLRVPLKILHKNAAYVSERRGPESDKPLDGCVLIS